MTSELAAFTLCAGGHLKQIPTPPLFFFSEGEMWVFFILNRITTDHNICF